MRNIARGQTKLARGPVEWAVRGCAEQSGRQSPSISCDHFMSNWASLRLHQHEGVQGSICSVRGSPPCGLACPELGICPSQASCYEGPGNAQCLVTVRQSWPHSLRWRGPVASVDL